VGAPRAALFLQQAPSNGEPAQSAIRHRAKAATFPDLRCKCERWSGKLLELDFPARLSAAWQLVSARNHLRMTAERSHALLAERAGRDYLGAAAGPEQIADYVTRGLKMDCVCTHARRATQSLHQRRRVLIRRAPTSTTSARSIPRLHVCGLQNATTRAYLRHLFAAGARNHRGHLADPHNVPFSLEHILRQTERYQFGQLANSQQVARGAYVAGPA